MSDHDKPATSADSLMKDARDIDAAFPWIGEGFHEIEDLITSGRPGLARAKSEQMRDRLKGRKSMNLCGIDPDLLAKKPAPDELAAIVARLEPGKAALFIALWSEQINVTHGPRAAAHIQAIAEAVVVKGLGDDDGWRVAATIMIHDLARALAERMPK